MSATTDSQRWCDICGPKRGFGDHHTDRHEDYAFNDEGVLVLPNGNKLVRHEHKTQADGQRYWLRGPKGGTRHAYVQLWVHGGRARSEAQFLSYLNGDSHDQSKCQIFTGDRWYDVS